MATCVDELAPASQVIAITTEERHKVFLVSQPSRISTPLRALYSLWPGEFLATVAVSAIAVAALLDRTILLTYGDPQLLLPYDHWKYIHMAVSNPLHFHIAPF